MRNRNIAGVLSMGLLLGAPAFGAVVAPPAVASSPVPLSFCYEASPESFWLRPDGQGEAIDRLQSVAEALGVRFTYVPMAAADCQLAVANGRHDGMLGVPYDGSVAWVGAFPAESAESGRRALFDDGIALVRERGAVAGDTVSDVLGALRGPVAAVPGSDSARELRALGLRVDDRTRSPRGLLERVVRSPVQAAAMPYGDAAFQLGADAELATKLELMPQRLVRRAYHVQFSAQRVAQDPALVESVWEALASAAPSEDARP